MKRFIGLCTAKIDGYFQTEFYCAALERAREYGYGLLVFNSGSELDTDDKYSLAEAKVFDLIEINKIHKMIKLMIKITYTIGIIISNLKLHLKTKK